MNNLVLQENNTQNCQIVKPLQSKIVNFIKLQSAKQPTREISYGDFCDWHDTCNCESD